MKVTKTSVHRLTIQKDCGCSATREYEDIRYTKPLAEAAFTPCEKHEKNKIVAEFAGEMLVEALNKEAESGGKAAFVPAHRQVAEGDNAGVQAPGAESVQALGIVMPKIRVKQDPIKQNNASFNRPDLRKPSNTDLRPIGNLNVAAHEDISPEELAEEGITMDYTTEDVASDPRVEAEIQKDMAKLEDMFDDEDSRAGGVDRTLVNRQAVD
jgi:hypothetical protein